MSQSPPEMNDPSDAKQPQEQPEVLVEITETFDSVARVTRISGKPEAVAHVYHAKTDMNANGPTQQISGSSAGHDIIQVTSIHYHITDGPKEKTTMADQRGEQHPAGSQSMEDVKSGGRISQTSDNPAEAQSIKRADAKADVVQGKKQQSTMNLGRYGARGWGVIALLIVVIAYFAYKYLVSRS